MTKNSKKITLIISGGLVIVLVVFVVWWQSNREVINNPVINTNISQPTVANTNVVTVDLTNNTNQSEEIIIENENLSMIRLANIFTERYGSYTSESEFKNTLDLKVYMTDSLIKWVDNYLASQSGQQSDGKYYSIITKVISNKIISEDNNSGTVDLITQRTENIGETENIFYQNITLELIYENEVWLVNKVTWSDKQ